MDDVNFEPGKILCEKDGWRVECLDKQHSQPFRILKKQEDGRYCTNYARVYLFADPKHVSTNAVIVVARSPEDAMEMANRFCNEFEPGLMDTVSKSNVGLEPVVILADSYYCPGIRFADMDDFSHLSERQVAVLRKKLDEQHPVTVLTEGKEENGKSTRPAKSASGIQSETG